MNIVEKKLKPTCGNCIYSYFKLDDPEETERCRILGRLHEVEINPLAKEALESFDIGEEAGFCEYHNHPKELKSRIDYSLISRKKRS